MTEGANGDYVAFESGFDPGDPIDQAIIATQRAVFPAHGLTPLILSIGGAVQFTDRADAGRQLAADLGFLRGSGAVVLGLPRGGVPVAFEVAAEIGAPLDVIVVRKLGLPTQPELAMGAIGEGGVRILNEAVVQRAWVTPADLAAAEETERQELDRQARAFRAGRARVDIAGRTAVLVDDGIATGPPRVPPAWWPAPRARRA